MRQRRAAKVWDDFIPLWTMSKSDGSSINQNMLVEDGTKAIYASGRGQSSVEFDGLLEGKSSHCANLLRSLPMVSFWLVVSWATNQPSSSSKMPLNMPPGSWRTGFKWGPWGRADQLVTGASTVAEPLECGPSHFRNPLVSRLIW